MGCALIDADVSIVSVQKSHRRAATKEFSLPLRGWWTWWTTCWRCSLWPSPPFSAPSLCMLTYLNRWIRTIQLFLVGILKIKTSKLMLAGWGGWLYLAHPPTSLFSIYLALCHEFHEYFSTVQDFKCIIKLKCLNLVIRMMLLRLLR